jgi:hypothetical protein
MNTSNEKFDLRSTNWKLLSRILGNSINNCDFLKFIISVRGGRCDYWPGSPKKSTYATGGGKRTHVGVRTAYIILVKKTLRERHFGELLVSGRIILKRLP